jgi:GPH family glycoside/pentoside/hexuronide:cation symporter
MVTIVYTAINLPYGTMLALITDDPKDQVGLSMFRIFGSLIIGVVLNMVAIPLIGAIGGEEGTANPKAWTIVFTGLGFLAMILFFICFKDTRERVQPVDKAPVPLKKAFPALFHNRFWHITLFTDLILQLSSGLAGVNVYYAQYILGDENLVGLLSMAGMLPMVAGMLVSSMLIPRVGKRVCVMAGCGISIFGSIIIAVSPAALTLVMAGSLLKGLGLGVLAAASSVMMPDVIDYGEWKFNLRSDGLVFSATSFGNKMGAGLGAALLGWLLGSAHYETSAAAQSAEALGAIRFMFIYLPILMNAAVMIIIAFYTLDKLLPQIRTELEKRRGDSL